jgi:hypothetical protein
MSFNVNALPVSIGGIVASFGMPLSNVGTAIVTNSIFVAGVRHVGGLQDRHDLRLAVGLSFRRWWSFFDMARAIMV